MSIDASQTMPGQPFELGAIPGPGPDILAMNAGAGEAAASEGSRFAQLGAFVGRAMSTAAENVSASIHSAANRISRLSTTARVIGTVALAPLAGFVGASAATAKGSGESGVAIAASAGAKPDWPAITEQIDGKRTNGTLINIESERVYADNCRDEYGVTGATLDSARRSARPGKVTIRYSMDPADCFGYGRRVVVNRLLVRVPGRSKTIKAPEATPIKTNADRDGAVARMAMGTTACKPGTKVALQSTAMWRHLDGKTYSKTTKSQYEEIC